MFIVLFTLTSSSPPQKLIISKNNNHYNNSNRHFHEYFAIIIVNVVVPLSKGLNKYPFIIIKNHRISKRTQNKCNMFIENYAFPFYSKIFYSFYYCWCNTFSTFLLLFQLSYSTCRHLTTA